MKKFIVGSLLALLVLGFAGGVLVVNAQTGNPPTTPVAPVSPMGGMMMQRGQNGEGLGIMHDALVALLSEKTGIAVADIEAKLDAGATLYTIATEAGLTLDDVKALQLEARDQALSAAVAAGTITQEQADFMKTRMFGQGRQGKGQGMQGMGANCLGTGTPMGGMRGGRWATP